MGHAQVPDNFKRMPDLWVTMCTMVLEERIADMLGLSKIRTTEVKLAHDKYRAHILGVS